ncbi:hypothetical protein [Roseivivax sp. THAF197b]|uniref:hypothetical protein n=1 Tax=Roseivivax sp. THAF197b TaxID=2588299 RepID=UPI0012689264|nr:hypothetical protein [Roseivivax sp. THAF197b]QFS83994.1 hypothetical protein FIV09_14250 [Roseivivax sp. THAF197b]
MQQQVNATELARGLNLSRSRISQLVSDGRLNGCYSGSGRSRRFDIAKVAQALGQKLDPGQLLGNGAGTKASLGTIAADAGSDRGDGGPANEQAAPQPATKDPSRYEQARTLELEEKARRARRQNEAEEGHWVLASEVASETSRQMAMEIAAIESKVLRGGARRLADELGVDFLQARAILTHVWREYRGERAEEKSDEAAAAQPSEVEQEADF